jgi:dTDP-4-amino-4,6-dideoxygalactose transaminase
MKERKELCSHYDTQLGGVRAVKPRAQEPLRYNYAYYPVIFESEAQLVQVAEHLNKEDIYPRRYFHPTLDELPYVEQSVNCPKAKSVASRVLCLPLYNGLLKSDIDRICKIILSTQN